MSIVDDYKRQFAWRDWATVFEALPLQAGQVVLDLGCGVGDLAAELSARGARVIGFDMNDELLDAARDRGLAQASFHNCDLRTLPDEGPVADGIWCSFALAYFTDFPIVLGSWRKCLREGGWIVLTEIDDLFGHQPIRARTKELLDSYARDALAVGRYDFHMGGKLRGYLEDCGFKVSKSLTLYDRELSFDGSAEAAVLEAWRTRLSRMKLLHDHCGLEFPEIQSDFLSCLSRPDHRSEAKVRSCIAIR